MWIEYPDYGPMIEIFLYRELWTKPLIFFMGDRLKEWFNVWSIAIHYHQPWESGFRIRHPLRG